MLLNGKKRKLDHDSTQESLQKLQETTIDTNDEIMIAHFMDLRWGSIVHAAGFLRRAAVAKTQLTFQFIGQGYKMIGELTECSNINPASFDLLLSADLTNRQFKKSYEGFGAGSFFLEDTRQRSYWMSVIHRVVAFNMGIVLYSLQKEALERAERRIAHPKKNEVLQVSSAQVKARNIPIKSCPLPLVHRQEWAKIRLLLGQKSYQEYICSGGHQEYLDYTKRHFQVCVKWALATLAVCQSFGPFALLWEALSPSCLYKLRHADLRIAAIDESLWSPLNRQLWGLTQLNPFRPFSDVQSDLLDVFEGMPLDFAFPEYYEYLEDDEVYKELRDKVLEEWEARNPPPK